jgi:hypothetical protein
MLTWLQNDLEATSKDWIIAFWHHPPYTKGTHDSDREFQLIEMRENVLPILEHHGVDLVLAGHSHVYERSYLLNGHYGYSTNIAPSMRLSTGSGNPLTSEAYKKPAGGLGSNRGTVYAVCGCSGQGGAFPVPEHPAIYYAYAGFGSMVLDITDNRLDAIFITNFESVLDRFTILKGPPGPDILAELAIEKVPATHQIRLAWPTSGTGHTLETSLSGSTNAPWTAVTNAPVVRGRKHILELETPRDPQWFRLIRD